MYLETRVRVGVSWHEAVSDYNGIMFQYAAIAHPTFQFETLHDTINTRYEQNMYFLGNIDTRSADTRWY